MHAHTSSNKPVFLINSRPRNNKSTGSFGPTLFCCCCRCSLFCSDSLRQKHACMGIRSGGCVCTGRHTTTMHRATRRDSIAVPLSTSRAKEKPGRADPVKSSNAPPRCQHSEPPKRQGTGTEEAGLLSVSAQRLTAEKGSYIPYYSQPAAQRDFQPAVLLLRASDFQV